MCNMPTVHIRCVACALPRRVRCMPLDVTNLLMCCCLLLLLFVCGFLFVCVRRCCVFDGAGVTLG